MTIQEYEALQVAAAARWLAARPVLDRMDCVAHGEDGGAVSLVRLIATVGRETDPNGL